MGHLLSHGKHRVSLKKEVFMTKKLFFIALAVGIGWLSLNRMVFADSYGKGEKLYDKKCVLCHGPHGKGNGPAAAAFSPPPADFTSSQFWHQKNIDAFIVKTIKNGHGAMPAFALNSQEIQAIIDYLSQAFKPKM